MSDVWRSALEEAVGPVAQSCGYGGPQVQDWSVTYCGSPPEIQRLHPWLDQAVGNLPSDQGQEWPPSDPRSCADLTVDWDGAVLQLRARPFIAFSLWRSVSTEDEITAALSELATELQASIARHELIEGEIPPARGPGSSVLTYTRPGVARKLRQFVSRRIR